VTEALDVQYENNHCLAVAKAPGALSAHFQVARDPSTARSRRTSSRNTTSPATSSSASCNGSDRVARRPVLCQENYFATRRKAMSRSPS
jgi:hypothetical protein